ncbi:tetratricopeptide repeat protein [candidate division CSSED10-310 bacterium]|uniref:Tetratricopeptide repeat protein n=1 Tax=candidate division CSSED10-310 bacterium TaxID=2855610 RepID=A0ABV6Z209_UNCC1
MAEKLLTRNQEGQWLVEGNTVETSYEKLPLPNTLRELLLRRLEGLPPAARELVTITAVCGQEVDARLLDQLMPKQSAQIMEGTENLLRQQILEEPRAGRLRFMNAQIREMIYERLPAEKKSTCHRAVAEAIESLFGKTGQEYLPELGLHWEHAGDVHRARINYLAAARQANSRYAFSDAENYYRAYLRLSQKPALETTAVRLELCRKVLSGQGLVKAGIKELQKAIEEARQQNQRRLEAECLLELSAYLRLTGQGDQAYPCCDQVMAICREIGERALEGKAKSEYGSIYFSQSRLIEARKCFDQALTLIRRFGKRNEEGVVLFRIGLTQLQAGNLDEASHYLHEAAEIMLETKNRHWQGLIYTNLAGVHHLKMEFEAAITLFEKALAIHQEVSHSRGQGIVLSCLGAVRLDQGFLEKAQQLLEQSLPILQDTGERQYQAQTLLRLGELERRSGGDLTQAEKFIAEAEIIFNQFHDQMGLISGLIQRGFIALARGELGTPFLDNIQHRALQLDSAETRYLKHSIHNLEQAVQALKSGSKLIHGECPDLLPDPLQ